MVAGRTEATPVPGLASNSTLERMGLGATTKLTRTPKGVSSGNAWTLEKNPVLKIALISSCSWERVVVCPAWVRMTL